MQYEFLFIWRQKCFLSFWDQNVQSTLATVWICSVVTMSVWRLSTAMLTWPKPLPRMTSHVLPSSTPTNNLFYQCTQAKTQQRKYLYWKIWLQTFCDLCQARMVRHLGARPSNAMVNLSNCSRLSLIFSNYALCTMHYALCTMLCALCTIYYALLHTTLIPDLLH